MTATAPPSVGFSRDGVTLHRVRERLWFEVTLDDVESVLDEHCVLTSREIAFLEARLGRTLRQLFAMASLVKPSPNPIMIAQAELLLAQPVPREELAALGHLRRVAVVVQELLPSPSPAP